MKYAIENISLEAAESPEKEIRRCMETFLVHYCENVGTPDKIEWWWDDVLRYGVVEISGEQGRLTEPHRHIGLLPWKASGE